MSQRLTITLDDETYTRLKEQAERDYRTIGAEICYLLHLHVPAYAPSTPASVVSTPEPFIKPTLAENPTDAPIITAQYKRKEI